MIKKIFITFVLLFSFLAFNGVISFVSAAGPNVQCSGLPGCKNSQIGVADEGNTAVNNFLTNIVTQFIGYIAVVAVIAVMFGGVMYMLSGGEEEKVNKAKKWIMWSLVGVLISISAYGIINFVNNLNVNLGGGPQVEEGS